MSVTRGGTPAGHPMSEDQRNVIASSIRRAMSDIRVKKAKAFFTLVIPRLERHGVKAETVLREVTAVCLGLQR